MAGRVHLQQAHRLAPAGLLARKDFGAPHRVNCRQRRLQVRVVEHPHRAQRWQARHRLICTEPGVVGERVAVDGVVGRVKQARLAAAQRHCGSQWRRQIAQVTQAVDAGHEQVGTAHGLHQPGQGEVREGRDAEAAVHRVKTLFEFVQRGLRADDRVLLLPHAARGHVALGPLAQHHLELAIQVAAQEQAHQAALILGGFSGVSRAIRHATAQHAAAEGLAGHHATARVHAPHMRTYGAAQALVVVEGGGDGGVAILLRVVEVIQTRSRRGVVQPALRQRRAIAPAAHQLGRHPLG